MRVSRALLLSELWFAFTLNLGNKKSPLSFHSLPSACPCSRTPPRTSSVGSERSQMQPSSSTELPQNRNKVPEFIRHVGWLDDSLSDL